MKQTAVGLLVTMTLMTGCIVSQSKHEQTLQDLQATKSDLDRMRVQNEALNRQVKVLQEAKIKLRDDLDRASGELGALTASAGKDRQAVDSKLKDLERQVKDLTRQRWWPMSSRFKTNIKLPKDHYAPTKKLRARQPSFCRHRARNACGRAASFFHTPLRRSRLHRTASSGPSLNRSNRNHQRLPPYRALRGFVGQPVFRSTWIDLGLAR